MKSNIFSKISFFFKKIPAIVIVGDRKKEVKEKTLKILKKYFQEGKDFLIFTANNKNIKNLNFFLKYSRKPIFVATSMNAIRKNVNKVTSSLSYKTNLILNFDNPITKKIEKMSNLQGKKYGKSPKANLKFSSQEKGFKVNYKGSIVPISLKDKKEKNIYSILAAIAIATSLNLNLVKISQAFKKD